MSPAAFLSHGNVFEMLGSGSTSLSAFFNAAGQPFEASDARSVGSEEIRAGRSSRTTFSHPELNTPSELTPTACGVRGKALVVSDAPPKWDVIRLGRTWSGEEPDERQAVRDGRSPLILTERNEHLERFKSALCASIPHVVVLRGGTGKKQRQAAAKRLAAIPAEEGRIILATGKYIGEGFDDSRLDTLFLTLPVSWRGTIAQYVGRLHRLYDGKREVRVYDYADLNVPMLARMFDRRCRGYEAVGYTIVLPASAIPGWPATVTLPADPLWKRDYAASVRRLVRDGVDLPLANLFLAAARPIPPEAEGANRARGASEAFLYRRLETLPETRGRFQLNTDVPIAFDGFGRMEVDLLCVDSRVVIEVDGAQHLADPIAYRRDRRKDQLLQENGYLVLRYLAEDLAKELDSVLDGILRSLAARSTPMVATHTLNIVRGSSR